MTKEEIGSIIKESRTAAGLTQLQVGDALKRPQTTIAAWEAGRSQPDANTLFDLFRVLGRSVDEAFGFQKNTPPLSGRALKMAQAFEKLDEKGKALLEDSLAREEQRVEMEKALNAYVRSFTPLRIYKTPITDKTGIDLTEEPELKMIQITSKTSEEDAATVRQVMLSENPFAVRFRYDNGRECIVAVDGDKAVEPGHVGIFTIGGKSFMKKLQNDGLYPVQDKYDPIPLPDVLHCAGRVIGLIGNVSVSDIYGTFNKKRAAPGAGTPEAEYGNKPR